MRTLADVFDDDAQRVALLSLLSAYGLACRIVPDDAEIPASYWGAPEAGIAGNTVYTRRDTPLHSLLHEACHLICMGAARRQHVWRDAGGSDIEEAAVCLLQLLLAAQLPRVGWRALAADMDTWGYSFRAGSTAAWFAHDAGDARDWLRQRGLPLAARVDAA